MLSGIVWNLLGREVSDFLAHLLVREVRPEACSQLLYDRHGDRAETKITLLGAWFGIYSNNDTETNYDLFGNMCHDYQILELFTHMFI